MIELYKTRGKYHLFISLGKLCLRTYQGFTKRVYFVGLRQ